MNIDEQWNILQEKEWQSYLNSPVGVFSIDGLKGAEVTGVKINKYIPGGLCLDVGSGALSKPYYMKIAKKVRFIGIDPYKGDRLKRYEFIQGFAEDLPFKNSIFDGVLFATSLDHVLNPEKALDEAYRVLKKGGFMFYWGGIKNDDEKYRAWLASPKPKLYDLHLWAFTDKSLKELFARLELVDWIRIREKKNNETLIVFKK